ncbi:reverse transcriptase domain-containing protein [Tanacetum coccineum]
MCVDFTDLNKACPQDCYPLPEIDWKVESLCGYPFKCFLDAYKGYHQIQMAESDEEKTAFHTSQGVYCYTKMPFGLKNIGATYQRLVDKAFDSQVGRNIEVYVDDLVIKSYTEAEMIRDIEEMFRTLRKINMKLNPKKCTFGPGEGMFLGGPELQWEVGQFEQIPLQISGLPLFKTLKKCIKKSDFHWTPEAEQAFKQLKQHLSELPLQVAPKSKEELSVYLSASYGAVSAVLMTERGTVQTPVYFVSGALQGPELNYTPMEKLVLSLVFAAKRLQRTVTKVERHAGRTQYHIPAKDVGERKDPGGLPCREAGRKSARHKSRGNPAGAVDTIYRWIIMCRWIRRWLNTDKPGGNGVHLRVKVFFYASNNEAEYEALIAGLRIAAQMGVRNVQDPSGDRKEASKLRIKARQYELLGGVLYRRSFLKMWLSMHAGLRSVVAKAMRLGYYWPTMHRDTRDMICACNDCQIHRPVPRNPQQPLTPITALWPFYKWGINIAGPFLEGPGKVKFLIVAMDYFTKWIEAKAVATITGNQVKKFVWDNIVCRFGLPGEIISENGKQFSDNPFKDWCEKLNIAQRFASVKHPQSNRLVERENRSLGEGIKARLGEGNNNWIEELSHVLWAHCTMIKSSHGDTSFSLTYGTEVVIPVKIGMPTYRTAVVDVVHNDEEIWLNLDLLEEKREYATICEAKAKLKMTKYYNARIRGVTFRPEDFVYRSNDASHVVAGGKLGPK